MQTIFEGGALPGFVDGSAASVGVFDGVHLGHQALLGELRRHADELQCPAVVVTFDRHPLSVVEPESAPKLLSSLGSRLEQFDKAGVDITYVLRFDEERSLEPAREFAREVLVDSLHVRTVVVGQEFHFGHHREGDVALLAELGVAHDFKVVALGLLPEPGVDHPPISSTAIREALARDDLDEAARMLGRPYEVRGVVERGDGRGRTIGFPTANVAVAGDIMLPGDGVFSGWYERPDGSSHVAALSLGRRPTFYAETGLRLLEAHLLDFDDDLYDERAKVRFHGWIRGQRRFESVDALVEQLHRDVRATREVMGQPEG